MYAPRILVVDDEIETLRYVGANLRARGYQVLTASDGAEGLKIAREQPLDLVILDIMMPGPDGFAICQEIRSVRPVPIIMLSARGREQDKVRALDLGADDYITKPFGIQELLARVRAALRRAEGYPQQRATSVLVFDKLTIDLAQREVKLDGRPVHLTPVEYELLTQLAMANGRVLTHRSLLQRVWGQEYTNDNAYLWTYIRRLRQKLEIDPQRPRYILTEPGVGYRMCSVCGE